jgi:hypothetical protein
MLSVFLAEIKIIGFTVTELPPHNMLPHVPKLFDANWF